MTRFVVLSFAVLGWAFYELSGGADFEPRRTSEVNSTTPPVETSATLQPTVAPKPEISVPATVRMVAPVAAVKPAEPKPLPVAEAPQAPAQDTLDQVRTSLSQGLALYPADGGQQLTLVSLEQGAANIENAPASTEAAAPSPAFVETVADIREITGTRVNMRDGPGTIYPVVARLSIGQAVEVLGESGTGWLRLKTIPGNQPGWISASLVSKAAN
jgi:hypothetical protein